MPDIEKGQNAECNSNGQPKDIDKGIDLMPEQISHSDNKIIPNHDDYPLNPLPMYQHDESYWLHSISKIQTIAVNAYFLGIAFIQAEMGMKKVSAGGTEVSENGQSEGVKGGLEGWMFSVLA